MLAFFLPSSNHSPIIICMIYAWFLLLTYSKKVEEIKTIAGFHEFIRKVPETVLIFSRNNIQFELERDSFNSTRFSYISSDNIHLLSAIGQSEIYHNAMRYKVGEYICFPISEKLEFKFMVNNLAVVNCTSSELDEFCGQWIGPIDQNYAESVVMFFDNGILISKFPFETFIKQLKNHPNEDLSYQNVSNTEFAGVILGSNNFTIVEFLLYLYTS